MNNKQSYEFLCKRIAKLTHDYDHYIKFGRQEAPFIKERLDALKIAVVWYEKLKVYDEELLESE